MINIPPKAWYFSSLAGLLGMGFNPEALNPQANPEMFNPKETGDNYIHRLFFMLALICFTGCILFIFRFLIEWHASILPMMFLLVVGIRHHNRQ